MKTRRAALGVLAAPFVAPPLRAQAAFPNRPLRLVVTYPPGGVTDIVGRYRGLIDIWDAINEVTVSPREPNTVGDWEKKEGAEECAFLALEWAHEANPKAFLIVNDFNLRPPYHHLID